MDCEGCVDLEGWRSGRVVKVLRMLSDRECFSELGGL